MTNSRLFTSFCVCSTLALALGCSASSTSPFPTSGGAGNSLGGAPGFAGSGFAGSTPSAGAYNGGLAGAPPSGFAGSPPVGTGGSFAAGGSAPSAGSGPAGGAPAAAGGAGPVGMSPAGFFMGGYISSPPWAGDVFTFSDPASAATVSPACTTTGCLPAWGTQPCVKGTVAKDPASASFIGLAFHTKAPLGGVKGSWAVTGTGLQVNISNPPAGARVQLQEPAATTNDQRYCAPLPAGGSGLIPFASIKTYCWNDVMHPSKALAAGTLIEELAITVPGNTMAAVPVDFCLVNIAPL